MTERPDRSPREHGEVPNRTEIIIEDHQRLAFTAIISREQRYVADRLLDLAASPDGLTELEVEKRTALLDQQALLGTIFSEFQR